MEDVAPKLFDKIQKEFERNYLKNKKIDELKKKLVEGVASYKDGHAFAIEVGTILVSAFEKNLSSEVLPNGRLYYNIADRIIRPMLKQDFDLIAEYSTKMQAILNKKAKIGIKAIKPEMNEDKVQGIIDITSGKMYFDDIAYMLGEPIINFSQAIIDDTVKANADFQYKAGLSPKIRRISTGKCCEWCDELAGIYDYEEVSDTGNNVFRRHRSCRCLVEYDPGDGKRQNVHTKKIYYVNNIKERAVKYEQSLNRKGKEVKYQYFNNATPGKGKIIIQSEEGYDRKQHEKEIATAKLIHNILGGDIELLPESNIENVKTPDYIWNGKYWDLKSTTSEKAANSAIRSGIKQIKDNPGGIILNYENNNINLDMAIDVIEKRMSKGYDGKIDIVIIINEKIKHILRY